MDQYKRLSDNLKRMAGGEQITIWQGIVKSVEGITCTVTFGNQDVSGVRLRASNIEALTKKINDLVDSFNGHTHMLASGSVAVAGSATNQSNPAPIQVPAIQQKANQLNRADYEDETIKH